MAHVKFTGIIAITNSQDGNTLFVPVDSIEVSNADYQSLLEEGTLTSGTMTIDFYFDENNNSLRASLEISGSV